MSARRKIGEERKYYSPPPMRSHNQKQQQLKLNSTSSSLPERRGFGSGSYLDRFLEHTTPIVPAQHFPKTRIRAWRNCDSEFHPYFILGDLWESFTEWSVYGAGVPLIMNGSDSVVQYYVPSLSGIQLYVNPSRHVVEQRRPVDEGDISNPPDLLIFEYFERELPFHREPLADKISILASHFPEIRTYRSCDLTSASWISVAWYPIYRIPVGPTLQNVDACFLTFHSLAKPVPSGEGMRDPSSKLSLPTFGLVSYKFKVNANGVYEGQKVNSLLRAADNWLRLLQVNHPDYSFFVSHNSYWR